MNVGKYWALPQPLYVVKQYHIVGVVHTSEVNTTLSSSAGLMDPVS